jgi:H+/Cl- antiporter ClcA
MTPTNRLLWTPVTIRDRAVALFRWCALGSGVGVLCGLGAALFLWLLEEATNFRQDHTVIVFALPIAGLAIGVIYDRYGQSIKGGNNLVIETIHASGPTLPARMAPMVVLGTVATHLFGGSAGREGTAVQMGASLSDWLATKLRVTGPLRTQLLVAGVAGGFGAVFGTPVAGAVFGLEVILLGSLNYRALVPGLTASIVGDLTARQFIGHAHYPTVAALELDLWVLVKWVVFAAAVAGTTLAFIELTRLLKAHAERFIPSSPWRLFAGGLSVVGLYQIFGTPIYLGLGVDTILASFTETDLPAYSFAVKLLFTSVTLSAGYLGGEVTPLFFVGATLGNALASPLGLPLDMAAGVGLAAVFAAAANTPLALSIMAVELLGANILPHVFIVSTLAYLMTGHRSIYVAQRLPFTKHGEDLKHEMSLKDLLTRQEPQPESSASEPVDKPE